MKILKLKKKIQSLKSHGKTILGRNKKILTNGSADVDKDEDEIQLPLKGILKTSTSKITNGKKDDDDDDEATDQQKKSKKNDCVKMNLKKYLPMNL